jgi:hypothetical protein
LPQTVLRKGSCLRRHRTAGIDTLMEHIAAERTKWMGVIYSARLESQ